MAVIAISSRNKPGKKAIRLEGEGQGEGGGDYRVRLSNVHQAICSSNKHCSSKDGLINKNAT